MKRAYKFRLYPTKVQTQALDMHRYVSKTLWNCLLEYSINTYNRIGKFPTKSQMQSETKNKGLYSQSAQEVSHRLHKSLLRCFILRKKGKKAGFPRFKNIDRAKSIYYPQSGFSVNGKKLSVTPFGEVNIKLHRPIEGNIKTLTLKRESSGKWFAVFIVEQKAKPFVSNNKEQAGIDLGLKTFVTISNGTKISNPRHLKKYEDLLALRQKQLSSKEKGSKNRFRAKRKVSNVYEKIQNARLDFLHKTSLQLVNAYSLIGLEKLQAQSMAEKQYGKQINDAGWGSFANMLTYKAENAGCQVIFVDARNTTKTCHVCGNRQDMPLNIRTYSCDNCGSVTDRDINASINILHKATTAGHAGSNAWGDTNG
ncbi:MAG: RNA-guided endonuclease InsQ/TnpB family protein [Candidatus Micrarchaeales archaeon]